MQPNLIALAVPMFFAGMLVELGVAKAKGRQVYRLGDAIADMGCGVTQQLVSLFLATGVLLGGYEWLYQHRFFTIPTTWLPWVVAVFGVEFAYYWWHRLSHEVNLLWAAHVVHHHSEDYNLAVALRQSVTTWLTTLPFYFPFALLGVPTVCFAVVLGLSTLYQFWIHTRLVDRLPGALEWALNTPSHHRVHHATNPEYLDKNHGAILIVWDRLFGTYADEVAEPRYGLTKPLASFNPLWAQAHYWIELARHSWRAPTVADKIAVWLRGPAWHPAWMDDGAARRLQCCCVSNRSSAARVAEISAFTRVSSGQSLGASSV